MGFGMTSAQNWSTVASLALSLSEGLTTFQERQRITGKENV